MGVFAQIIILMAVLACMVMVLLGIRQLTRFEGFDDAEETRRLKEEVEEDNMIMSNNNIFNRLLESDEKTITKKNYKTNSKEPFSRKE